MPIYAYKCSACGFAEDKLQKISDAPLTVCPQCNQAAYSKQVTAAGFQLKGSGWYVTDFRSNGSGGAKTSEAAVPVAGSEAAAGGSGSSSGSESGSGSQSGSTSGSGSGSGEASSASAGSGASNTNSAGSSSGSASSSSTASSASSTSSAASGSSK